LYAYALLQIIRHTSQHAMPDVTDTQPTLKMMEESHHQDTKEHQAGEAF